MTAGDGGGRLLGILITFRRPRELDLMLQRLAGSGQPVDLLVVVDNSPTPEAELLVEGYRGRGRAAEYVAAGENLGPAGAVALAMRRLLPAAADEDWIVLFDDGEPPGVEELAEMRQFALSMRARDPRLGAVGGVGATFDWARGRVVRVPDDRLDGPVPVDYIGSGQLPLYSARAVRAVGVFKPELFFGFEELEYGLRLRAAGWSLYVDGDRWRAGRSMLGRLDVAGRPTVGFAGTTWRDYYRLRNLIDILRCSGRRGAAIRVSLLVGLLKPLANAPRQPGRALARLRLNWRACRDGWRGTLGRTIEPEPSQTGSPAGAAVRSA